MAEEQVRKTGFEIAQKLDSRKDHVGTDGARQGPDHGGALRLWRPVRRVPDRLLARRQPVSSHPAHRIHLRQGNGLDGHQRMGHHLERRLDRHGLRVHGRYRRHGLRHRHHPAADAHGLRPQADRPRGHDPAGCRRHRRHLPARRVRERGVEVQADVGDHQALALHRHPRHPGRNHFGDLGLRHLQGGQGLDQPLRLRAAARHGRDFPFTRECPTRAIASTGPR